MSSPFLGQDVQSRVIIENDLAFAFPTNIPIVSGHTLISPKREVVNYDDLTKEEKEAIFDLLGRIKKSLIKAFGAEGFNVAWNEGEVAGQSVKHFHLHVLPRKEGDSGVTEYDPRKFLYRPGERETTPEEELQKVAEIIKKNILVPYEIYT